jgi:ubiquinol-cytochrome c reductase cytochrome b subunit
MANGLWNRLDRWVRLSRLSFPVPAHSKTLLYTLGAITFVGLMLLFATGLVLSQFFNPQPDQANQSVHYIVNNVPGGSWVRSLHYWTAQAMVVSILAHLSRVFITGAYKFPRILTWYTGVGLFFTTTMLSFFSGTVIKWDQEGYEALHHYKAVVGMLGSLGTLFGEGLTQSISLNVRMYTFHITLAPLLLIFLIVCHFYLIHVFNISPLPRGPSSSLPELLPSELTSRFTEDIKSIIRSSLIFYGFVAVLAAFVPAPLAGEHSPEFTGAKPPWVFLWQYGIEHFTGIPGILYSSLLLLFIFLVIPWIDRRPNRDPRERKGVLALGAVTALAMVGFTVFAWVAPPEVHHEGRGHHMEDMPGMEGHSDGHSDQHSDKNSDEHPHSNTEAPHTDSGKHTP